MGISVGLPRMVRHPGERRDFLPGFVQHLAGMGAGEIVMEEGYGSGADIAPDAYLQTAEAARFGPFEECLDQDVVVVLRCPPEDALKRLRPGSILVSMLHYATRPIRNDLLRELGVRAVSLDSVTDDRGRRMVENLELTAWSGVAEAFRTLASAWAAFAAPGRAPIHATILGSGALGGHAVHACTRYGDHELRDRLHGAGVPGVEVAVIDHDLSWHEDYMLGRLRTTELLVDATLRRDPTLPVIPNGWIDVLPDHAVLLDLAADPYDLRTRPIAIKAIEGVPHGWLEHHVFPVDDAAWDELGDAVDTTFRRTALSCNAWPGLRPRDSMARYGEQIEGIMEVILQRPVERWEEHSPHHAERAVVRGELDRWLRSHAR